ncbi:MAG: hypothetical protein A2033_16295 [Bacteroidetes bacterium GWA2_31_9]|nr:MAG: hypothetical protein A2033_16295 [Bacteroidetes bacterium GWA2_31_9]
MKKIIYFLIAFCVLSVNELISQNIAITDDDAYTASSSAMLDVKSLSKGFLTPRLTTAQRNAILTPATGLLVFDTSLNGFYYYNGTAWINLSSGSSSGLLWSYNSPYVYLSGSSDKVGIGTSVPLHKLHVSDVVIITDGTDGSFIDIQNANATSGIQSGIRFFNGTSTSRIKGGIFYKDALSFGRGDLILANNSIAANGNVSTADARLTIKNTGGIEVKGTSGASPSASLFHVLNATGDTIFAVYDGGVRINVYDDPLVKATSSKGGFAVGGFSPSKGATTNDYLTITPDSVRIYVEDNPAAKATSSKGGFAVGGFSPSKVGLTNEYLRVTSDTTRIYTMDTVAGFGIKNLEASSSGNYLRLSPKNYFIGHNAGKSVTTGIYNTMIGYTAGTNLTTGFYNTYLGYQSAYTDNQGVNNVFIGYKTGYKNKGWKYGGVVWLGSDNTFIGTNAGYNNNEGYANTFIGYNAGYSNTGYKDPNFFRGSGASNIFIGDNSGYRNTIGNSNLFIGTRSGYKNEDGNYNLALGEYAGQNHRTGDYNVFIGSFAGNKDTSGVENVYIGRNAGEKNHGNNNIFIGRYAGGNETNTSYKLFIDNTTANSTTAFIYGDLTPYSRFMRMNQKVGINTNPTYQLHVVDNTTSSNTAAIYASKEATEGYGIGVEGHGNYKGVRGYATTTYTSATYGGEFRSYNYGSGNSYGIYGYAYSGTGTAYAGYFLGNVSVTGTLSKGGGSFKIDHPLDPENKYLYHSFVESPDMKNIYDGVVVLDANGEATVTMPDWFDALNNEFRYQLTAIGGSAPNIYISQEIANNQFKIAGGTAGLKISWMLTGIRKDPFANQNRIPVEVEKSQEEKGLYLYPDAYGKGQEKAIDKNINE